MDKLSPQSSARLPVCLTIAGSDSGGGAGLQADLKTFQALGVWGCGVVAAVTAQNPLAVTAAQGISAGLVLAQLKAVLDYYPVAGAKTGMLYRASVIRAVGQSWPVDGPPLVVDPVAAATSGAPLLGPGGVKALERWLLPRAALITPNLAEAALLAGFKVADEEAARRAAQTLAERYGTAVLVKGGHATAAQAAVDWLARPGQPLVRLEAPWVAGGGLHGTGCTLSAAIAAYLALGQPLERAVAQAKAFLGRAMAGAVVAGKGRALQPLAAAQAMGAGTRDGG